MAEFHCRLSLFLKHQSFFFFLQRYILCMHADGLIHGANGELIVCAPKLLLDRYYLRSVTGVCVCVAAWRWMRACEPSSALTAVHRPNEGRTGSPERLEGAPAQGWGEELEGRTLFSLHFCFPSPTTRPT